MPTTSDLVKHLIQSVCEQDNVRRRLDQKTQELLHDRDALHEELPSNVEPGFEAEYRQRTDHGQTMQQLRKRSVFIIRLW